MKPTPAAQQAYGYSLFVGFHIVRAVIFRCLWIRRNDVRFNDAAANLLGIQTQIHAVVNTHKAWLSQYLASYACMLSALHIRLFRPSGLLHLDASLD